jgi:hypothetical protein
VAKTTKKPVRKSTRAKSPRRTVQKSDHLVWFERARAMHEYSESLKQADAKALKLFEIVADQLKNQFRLSAFLFGLIMAISLGILTISLVVLFIIPFPSIALQRFSSVGTPISLFALILLLFRNPIVQARHLLESVLKLNVVFISFIHRVQQSDLLLQSMFYEKDTVELDKLYLLMQEFQGIVDQTQQEISQTDQT